MKAIFALVKTVMVFFAFTLSVTQPTTSNIEDDENYGSLAAVLQSGSGWISFNTANANCWYDPEFPSQCNEDEASGTGGNSGRMGNAYLYCKYNAQVAYDQCKAQGSSESVCSALYQQRYSVCN